MFEWHGWATILASSGSEGDDAADTRQREVVAQVEALADEASGVHNETVDLRVANGLVHLWLAGSDSHRADDAITLYRAIARAAPGSYGVMSVLDLDRSTTWERWVMRRGEVIPQADRSLSPHIPVAEDS